MAKAKQNKVESKVEESTVIGETASGNGEKAKRGGNVKALYIAQDGKEVATMPEMAAGVIARVGLNSDGTFGSIGEKAIMLRDLPTNTQFRLMAFGLRTLMQNAVNTIASSTTVYEGWEALERRVNNLVQDIWAETGSGGGGVPLYLQAFQRAMTDAGHPADAIQAKFEQLLAIYNDDTGGEKEQEKRRKDLRTQLMSRKPIELAFFALQEEAAAKRRAAAANAGQGNNDLSDLI